MGRPLTVLAVLTPHSPLCRSPPWIRSSSSREKFVAFHQTLRPSPRVLENSARSRLPLEGSRRSGHGHSASLIGRERVIIQLSHRHAPAVLQHPEAGPQKGEAL